MMRSKDPQNQEDGFHSLLPRCEGFVQELIDEFKQEKNHGLQCWFLELIGEAKSPDAFEILAEQLVSHAPALQNWARTGLEKLDTKEARTLLWKARTGGLPTNEVTEFLPSPHESESGKE